MRALSDGLDLAWALQPALEARQAADSGCAKHQAEGVDCGIAEDQRQVGEMLRGERQALLRVGLEAAAGTLGRGQRGEPQQGAQGVLVVQLDPTAGFVGLDDIEQHGP